MELYLDTSDPKEIAEVRTWGLLDGVTTNPSLISRGGPDMLRTLSAVLEVCPGPVFAQAVGWHEVEPLVDQAKWLHDFSDRIIVKLPMSVAGIRALLQLRGQVPEIRIAITAVASIAQAYLCGKAGADVVAMFNGPLDEASDTPVELVAPVRKVYDNYGFTTKILSCGRYPRSFSSFAVAGSDICTMKFAYWKLLYQHPFTDQRINGFLQDWSNVFGEETWLDKEG
jgi:transaldolase